MTRPCARAALVSLALAATAAVPGAGGECPRLVGRWVYTPHGDPSSTAGPLWGGARGVTISGDLAYVGVINEGLVVLDVSDPRAPTEIAFLPLDGYPEQVVLVGRFALVPTGSGEIAILSLDEPAAPELLDTYWVGLWPYELAVVGGYGLLADGGGGMRVLDLSDLPSLTDVGAFEIQDHTSTIATAGDLAFLNRLEVDDGGGWDVGVLILSVADPLAPVQLGLIPTPDPATNACQLAPMGHSLLVAHETAGLQIVDVAGPSRPVEVGDIETSASTFGVTVHGRCAVVADGEAGIRVIDLSRRANPVERGAAVTAGPARRVTIDGQLAYVAAELAGVEVYDLAGCPCATFGQTSVRPPASATNPQ